MKKIRVAVIGYGHLGKWHCQKVEACQEHAELFAIVESSPLAQSAARLAHPNARVVSDLADVITDIDAGVVVTPTSTHLGVVMTLLHANKHIFCEKPLCSNDEEAKKLKMLAQDTALVLQVGHSERFHEAWEKLKFQLINLKPPYTVRINRVAPFKGRAVDVDVIQDLGIHDLDLILFLFKQKPLSVEASAYKIRTTQWDHAHIKMNLEESCEVFINLGRNAIREIRDLEVISSEGVIHFDLFSNKICHATNTNFEDGTFVKEESYQKRDHLFLEHSHFYHSIRSQTPAIIGREDGIKAVHLVDACLKSISSHRAVKVTFE